MLVLDPYDVQSITDVLNLPGDDYITLKIKNGNVNFISGNAELFMSYDKAIATSLNVSIRIMKESLHLICKVGIVTITEKEDVVFLGHSKSVEDCSDGKYTIFIGVKRQSEVDSFTDRILKMIYQTEFEQGRRIHNIAGLKVFDQLSNLGGKGVILNDEKMYTSGAGFKAFTLIPRNECNFGISPLGLKKLVSFTKNMQKTDLFEVDNFVVCKDNRRIIGIRKMIIKNFRELEGLKDLPIDDEFDSDLTELMEALATISVGKGDNFKFSLNPMLNSARIEEKRRGILIIRMSCSENSTKVIKLDLKLLKSLLQTLNKGKTKMSVKLYENIIEFINDDGVHVMMGREE